MHPGNVEGVHESLQVKRPPTNTHVKILLYCYDKMDTFSAYRCDGIGTCDVNFSLDACHITVTKTLNQFDFCLNGPAPNCRRSKTFAR